MTDWYYADADNARQGPLPPETLRDLYQRGEVHGATLVWHDGLDAWTPLRDCLQSLTPGAAAHDDATTRATAAASSAQTLTDADGRQHIAAPDASPDASPYAPPAAPLEQSTRVVHGGEVVDAGFLKRVAALCIDNLLLTVVYYALMLVLLLLGGMGSVLAGGMDSASYGPTFAILMGLGYLSWPLLSGLYYVLMESSAHQASLGKMAVGIKVTALDGTRIRRGHALGRWVSHVLNYLTLYIGYLLPLFTRRKQGLHDLVARTYVVDRWAYTDTPERQQPRLGTAATVVLVIVGVGVVGGAGLIAMAGLASAFL
ncbi:transporter [Lysobacteraceae bacterium NML93-0399]|nr:transporter [Xanthomonadaceae bacterium NML93-0399]